MTNLQTIFTSPQRLAVQDWHNIEMDTKSMRPFLTYFQSVNLTLRIDLHYKQLFYRKIVGVLT